MVSAAAGSGKTAVLVERIKQLILNGGCSIDRMLVVTFTNAAASEMKAKIEDSIRKEISALDGNDSREARGKTARLKEQLDLLPMAQISTFHSFSMEVVKRFFYTIGCEPNFKICDEARKAILQAQAMDELMESRYENGGSEFYGFLDRFSGDRNDYRVRSMIESLYERMDSMPDPVGWLEDKTEELAVRSGSLNETGMMDSFWDDVLGSVERQAEILRRSSELAQNTGLEKGFEFAESDRIKMEGLLDVLRNRDYSLAREAINGFALDRMNKAYFDVKANPGVPETDLKDAKEYIDKRRKNARDRISELKSTVFSQTEEQIISSLRETYEDVRYLAGLTEEYEERYREIKKEKGLMDFSDLEHYAYEILKQDEAAEFYRNKFIYIFVDEYQDSNVLQEALIERIAGERNLFTVGDVKQSIYRFRLAEPDIFRSRYLRYRDESKDKGNESTSKKIDLNNNFRSKNSILDFINEVFYETMEDYNKDEALYPGNDGQKEMNYEPKLFIADESWDDDGEIDDSIRDLKKTEKEALLIAKIIKENLGKEIYDTKDGESRPLRKKDIVILMRGVKDRGDQMYKVLTEQNIPCYVDDNKGYFDTIEINTFMSLIRVIDNHKQDIPLITVMRSEIMNFSVNELAEIRAEFRDVPYSTALKNYSEEGSDEHLKAKCLDAVNKISSWQEMAAILPLEELVWKLMLDTGFYAAMGAMPAGYQRQANLRLLADKALDYRKNQNAGLYGFINYVDHIKDKEVSMGQARVVSEDEDTVRIMTIHHSKGLEFPMVILAGFTRKLGGSPRTAWLQTDKDLGIGLPIVDHSGRWYRETVLQTLIKRKEKREEIREEKRILYVAMTRAKDILYMTGTLKNAEETLDTISQEIPSDGSYFDMTGGIIARKMGRAVFVEDRKLSGLARARNRSIKRALDIMDEEPAQTDPETERIMRFTYPYENETRVKSKYSVSELNSRGIKTPMTFDASVPRVPEKYGLSASHIGTVTHSVLERMDFAKLSSMGRTEGTEYLNDLTLGMVTDESLTADEKDAIDKDRLYEFAVCPLGRRIAEAQKRGELFREKPFNIRMDVDGEDALVQGIIDCFFIEEGRLILVDYKTTAPRNVPGIKERYRIQMEIYREALTEAMDMEVSESYLYLTNLGVTVDM